MLPKSITHRSPVAAHARCASCRLWECLANSPNVHPQSRGLPPETHGSPSPEAQRQAAASSVRLDLDGKWNCPASAGIGESVHPL